MRRLALPLTCALLLAAPFCFALVADTDAGWHLALGRLIATQGLPHTNALTWTARDVPWYDTSWLWDWVSYLLVARFGLTENLVRLFIQVHPDFRIEGVEVLLSPDDFEARPI